MRNSLLNLVGFTFENAFMITIISSIFFIWFIFSQKEFK
jgi:hypothetical protein